MIEKTLTAQRAFSGRLLSLDVLEVELEPGVRSRREVVHHPGAVAVLARTPDRRFVLVRQYRKPIEQEVTEIIAGCLEPGEQPAACAAREVREETGHVVSALTALGVLYPTPGYTDETIHLFMAELDPSPAVQQTEHDERIVIERLDSTEIERRMLAGQIRDGKTLAAWALYKLANP